MDFKERVPLGRTGLMVSRIGLASGYGVPAAAILVWGLTIFSLVLTLIFHRDLALVPLPREETVEEEAAEQKRSMRSE